MDKNEMPEVVRHILESGVSLNTIASAEPFEVIALLENTYPQVIDDARKTIILAKQSALIDSLMQERATGVEEDEKSDAVDADSES